MNISSLYSSIRSWFGTLRMKEAVRIGSMRREEPSLAKQAPQSEITEPIRPVLRATYDHPYLGKHIDILI